MDSNLSLAIEAAIEAGKEILKIYDKDFSVEYKEDNSPITDADITSNKVIVNHLKTTNISIISEEIKADSYKERVNWNFVWIVDPLDGTKEFVKKNGEFTVNIALVENGVPILGVIYAPVKKELFYADKNGSFKVKNIESFTELDRKEKIKLIGNTPDEREIIVVSSRSHVNKATQDYIEKLKETYKNIKIVSAGSSLKLCMLAEGKAHVYPRFAPIMEWDTAAGHAICKFAGISVTTVEGNKELIYNKEDLFNPFFIAGDHRLIES
ncbi:3'(2'),5'-bisphosphate nucleotidase CysQ [Weeksellaceae bacterium TAE3-ERU29]|nr:3'(2'),5'-bisphosphate nucleotidase CysQ [Weeksellaceae bacterium TAE3-ERU29]